MIKKQYCISGYAGTNHAFHLRTLCGTALALTSAWIFSGHHRETIYSDLQHDCGVCNRWIYGCVQSSPLPGFVRYQKLANRLPLSQEPRCNQITPYYYHFCRSFTFADYLLYHAFQGNNILFL